MCGDVGLSLSSVSTYSTYMLAFIADVSILNVCIYCYLICNTVTSLFQLCMNVCSGVAVLYTGLSGIITQQWSNS